MRTVSHWRFKSREEYGLYQARIAEEALVPLVARLGIELSGRRLLDVGCGNAGMTDVWRGQGARAVGVDLDWARLAGAEGVVAGDVTALPFRDGVFDVVFAHDVMEHVASTAGALDEIARVLAAGGRAFVSFPPYLGAYGGHQQACRSVAKYMPWGHLLPRALWMSVAGSPDYEKMFEGLARLSLEGFERHLSGMPLRVVKRLTYVVRPEVAARTGLPVLECRWLARVPLVREFVIGAAFYLLEKT